MASKAGLSAVLGLIRQESCVLDQWQQSSSCGAAFGKVPEIRKALEASISPKIGAAQKDWKLQIKTEARSRSGYCLQPVQPAISQTIDRFRSK